MHVLFWVIVPEKQVLPLKEHSCLKGFMAWLDVRLMDTILCCIWVATAKMWLQLTHALFTSSLSLPNSFFQTKGTTFSESHIILSYRAVLYSISQEICTRFLLCFVVVILWLIFPYPSGLLHWHCGNLTIAPVPAKQPWWIWINTSCEFIMNDCITTTKQNTTKPCAYFLGYTVYRF